MQFEDAMSYCTPRGEQSTDQIQSTICCQPINGQYPPQHDDMLSRDTSDRPVINRSTNPYHNMMSRDASETSLVRYVCVQRRCL